MINFKVLGPQQSCKSSFIVTVSFLILLLISFSSQAKGVVQAYSVAIDDIIEEGHYKGALSNSGE
jgi:hypothetical protein